MIEVSIHAPVKGATHIIGDLFFYLNCFNPRTREGCDLHGLGILAPDHGFNPRTREGCDFAAADEVDAYPDKIKKEGDVISLVRSRTNAYSRNRKILWISTPLVEQSSKIYRLYLLGDQEKFFVPCKFCGEYQELVWHGVKEDGEAFGIVWENDDHFIPRIETVGYKCPYCGGLMKNYDKIQ